MSISWTNKYCTIFLELNCVMKMEPNLILNGIGCKFFAKMTRIESFRNPKNWSQDKTKSFIRLKKKTDGTKIKGLFWNQEPDNTSILNWI
jgi:hypothetical protein